MEFIYLQAITEYNDILCGVKKRFSKDIPINEKTVREIGRFAFSYYMRWSPTDIKERLTKEILQQLQLDKLFEKVVPFPHELNIKKDLYYYAQWLYPEVLPYDVRSSVLRVYRDVLDGKRALFSMNFFADDFAVDRADICLQEAIRRTEFRNVSEIYQLFASDKAMEFLEKFKLTKPLQMYHKSSPLQFLFSALPEEYRDEFWYNYYVFLGQYQKRILPQNTERE